MEAVDSRDPALARPWIRPWTHLWGSLRFASPFRGRRRGPGFAEFKSNEAVDGERLAPVPTQPAARLPRLSVIDEYLHVTGMTG